MNCYESRPGRHYIGGDFAGNDGSYRLIPDRWLHEAKIESDGNTLRLFYSKCTIEIFGFRLKKIYDDTLMGRLGKVTIADPSDDIEASEATEEPFVTNIIHLAILPEAANDLEPTINHRER